MEQTVTFGEDPEGMLLLKGKELLSEYYRWPVEPILDAGIPFQIPLVDRATGEVLDVPLRGVIDLIQAGGTLVEFKTSQRRWSMADIPNNIQLTAYSMAYELLYGRPAKDLKLVNLVKTRTPLIEEHVTGRDQTDYTQLFHLAKEVLKGIRNDIFFPNPGCWLCRDCEYDQDCREWTGNEQPQKVVHDCWSSSPDPEGRGGRPESRSTNPDSDGRSALTPLQA